jgi:hypothetical protein
MVYGAEGLSDNALRMRGSRLERSEAIDDEDLGKVAQARRKSSRGAAYALP